MARITASAMPVLGLRVAVALLHFAGRSKVLAKFMELLHEAGVWCDSWSYL